MQSILDRPTQIEAIGSERQNNFGAVAQQVNWLKTIENLYCMLVLLLPVFFLPITADQLNLNKAYLTIGVALLTLVFFFANAVQKGKLSLFGLKSYWGLSVLALAAIVSTIFSINKENSIFGHFGNYTDSLMFIISLTLIGFVAANVRLNMQKLMKFFAIGVTLSTLVSLLVMYGVSLPGLGDLPRVFTLSLHVYVLFGLEVVAILIALFQLLNTQSMKSKVLYTSVLVINAIYLIAMLNISALIVLGISLLVLFFFVHKEVPAGNKTLFIGILIALGVLGFVHHYPMTRDALGLNEMNVQPRLALRESWIITAETLKDRPLVGSGVGTFVSMFSLYRPASLNLTTNWQARFESPYSDVLLWIGNAGLVGFLAYLAFVGFAVMTIKSLSKEDTTSKLLILVISASVLTLIFLGSSPLVSILLFISLGAAIQRSSGNPVEIRASAVPVIFALLAVGLLGYGIYNASIVYRGQYFFRQSLTKDNLGERFQLQAKAIDADPRESLYQRSYISTGVAIASVLVTKEDLTDEEKQQIVNILSQSFNNVRYVTESFEPINVANWSLRGDLYASVMDITENADAAAVTAYRNAIQLEGTNPNLWINLGSVYYRRQVYVEAINAFVRAVQLKPDYANARYNLAYALKDAGYLADAVTQMEVALRLVPEGTPDFEKATTDLENFKKLLADATAAQEAQAPEGVSEVDNAPANEQTSTEPLVAPEDQPATQVESTDADVQSGVEEIVSEDDQIQPADGSEVPEGGTEAPIANPAN